jgi:hypothetical protein
MTRSRCAHPAGGIGDEQPKQGVASGTQVQAYRRTDGADGAPSEEAGMSFLVPVACTLPTAAQPLRLAEFDALFATAVREVQQVGPTHARLRLAGPAGLTATVRDLTARETECCSFFVFTVTTEPAPDGEVVVLDVEVPDEHAEVLGSLAQRASTVSAGRTP